MRAFLLWGGGTFCFHVMFVWFSRCVHAPDRSQRIWAALAVRPKLHLVACAASGACMCALA